MASAVTKGGAMDSGPPGWFVGWMLFVVAVGIGGVFVRLSVARSLARKTGVDEDAAVKAEIFGTGAITSTYLDLHRTGAPAAPAADDPGHVVADLSPHLRRDIGED